MKEIYFYIFCVLAAAVFATAGILFSRAYDRKKMHNLYEALLNRLDRAIGGGWQEEKYDESLDNAIAERLNRLLEISALHSEQAETERDAIQSVVSNITHQIRTPVTNLMLYTGLLQEMAETENGSGYAGSGESELREKMRPLLQKIQKQTDKLDFFVKELVKSTYTEREIISLHPEMTDAGEILAQACQMVELAAMKKGITICCETVPVMSDRQVNGEEKSDGDSAVLCYADKKWTVEALANVLENAVKYSPEESEIAVSIRAGEAFVCIAVRDNGIGIREEEQGRIFERFYRAEEVSGEPGFGIGLYLVREVLSRQGGYARVQSVPGEGTTMYLYLSRYEVRRNQ